MKKTFIVTESGCDLIKNDIEKYDIRIVPMHVSIEGKSLDDSTFPVTDIFESYKRTKHLPKTSGASPYEYEQVLKKILSDNPDTNILHLGYSAVTTVSYHNAILAGEGYGCITHIDTQNVSAGRRAIIIKMAQYLEKHPDATPQQLKEKGEELVKRCKFSFFPGDLEYLKAGGRVSNAAYLVASILGLKPLIEMLDGKLVGTKKYRGTNDKVFVRFLNEYLAVTKLEKDSFFMVYSPGLPEKTKTELEAVANKYGYKNFIWVPTGCVISTHAGPGAFGVGGFTEN